MRFWLAIPFLLIAPAALGDGFPSGQSPPGSPSQGAVLQLLIGGVSVPVSIGHPIPVTGLTSNFVVDDTSTFYITDDAGTNYVTSP